MPRKIVELLHYERTPQHYKQWSYGIFREFFSRIKAVSTPNFSTIVRLSGNRSRVPNLPRPNLLRRLAMDFKRVRDIEAFNAQLRPRSEGNVDAYNRMVLRESLALEASTLENRRKLSKKINLTHYSKEKYG